MFNWVDLVIFFILIVYIFIGLRQGFLQNFIEFLGFIISFFVGLKFFGWAGGILARNFSISYNFAKALGFLLVVLGVEGIFFFLIQFLYPRIPFPLRNSRFNKFTGIIPSLAKAIVLVSIGLTFVVALPFSGNLKKSVLNSYTGSFLVRKTAWLSGSLENIFGGAINDTVTFLTVTPESQEKVDLDIGVQPTLSIDEDSEYRMLELVNKERLNQGLNALVMDFEIREVARAHSRDMFNRSYFSHINPDGLDPFDRMKAGGIEFTAAGENLALAPDVELAHTGLMNSPGHRANILSPDFNRVGIGVIDGGVEGKMFTQNFAN